MTSNHEHAAGRRVVANIGLSLDGYYRRSGDEGIAYLGDAEVGYDQIVRTIETATTAVLGRVNAEEFLVWWPSVIGTEKVDPRDEKYAKWLVAAEKIVLTSTLTESPWEGVRVVNAPAAELIAELKSTGQGDILINWSASVIKQLLAADAIDRLNLVVAPVLGGDGIRLFDDDNPLTDWKLVDHQVSGPGVLALTYDRVR
ncbi:dihydrofolate reductase family protein [Microlunatus sp. GCM10028923]|uniref:dihydrofolate reductase family protein n=1 Tax=Microlunatus sp. GCM10028923 TaxID=3273400 RepID=UPI00361A9DF8